MWEEEEETQARCICPDRHAAALPAAGNWVVSGLFIPPAARLPRLPAASSRAGGTRSPDWQTSSRPAVSQLSSSSPCSSCFSLSADAAFVCCSPASLLSPHSVSLFACSDGSVDSIERRKALFSAPVILAGAAKVRRSFSTKFNPRGIFFIFIYVFIYFVGQWKSWKRSKIEAKKKNYTNTSIQNNVA